MFRAKARRFGVIAMGGCDPAVREALDQLDRQGTPADYLRVRGFPFGEAVERFLAEHDFCFVVEQNRDAQLRSLLTLETACRKKSCEAFWCTEDSR